MKLDEIDRSLPNGFHDSYIQSIHLDYEKREARLKINIWMGDLSSDIESIREAYKTGEFIISGLIYFVIDPPDSNYEYSDRSPLSLWVDAGPIEKMSKSPPVSLLKKLPRDSFTYCCYVSNWNACFILPLWKQY